MDNLVNYMDTDFSVLLGAVKCLPMPSCDRDAVTQTIHQQCSKIKVSLQLEFKCSRLGWLNIFFPFLQGLVFTVLIGNNQLISLVRVNKKHLLHPSDVHLIINLVNSSETFKTAEGWTPICLPHYDPRSGPYPLQNCKIRHCYLFIFYFLDLERFCTFMRHTWVKIVKRACSFLLPIVILFSVFPMPKRISSM
jgi:hypothetical protein